MSAADCQNEILDPMQRLFLPPRSMDETQQGAALREYVDALRDFDSADLKAAWQAVRDTHTTRSWPVPAAFILAARQSRKNRHPDSAPKLRHSSSQDGSEHWDRWKSIRNQPVAKEAVRKNVAWAFKCAVLNDKKRPEQIDLRELVIGKASAEATAAKIESGEIKMRDGIKELALSMWRTLLERESETQGEINFRAVP